MKITFTSKNGYCPAWEHAGITYFLWEDYDGTWTLKSRKHGFVSKTRFYKKGIFKIYPSALLNRYFKDKKNVKYERSGHYQFWYWNGMIYATNGEKILIKYQAKFERPSFDSYLECLKDAKEYLTEKYADNQLSLFE